MPESRNITEIQVLHNLFKGASFTWPCAPEISIHFVTAVQYAQFGSVITHPKIFAYADW